MIVTCIERRRCFETALSGLLSETISEDATLPLVMLRSPLCGRLEARTGLDACLEKA
jgi:hypothetical protein